MSEPPRLQPGLRFNRHEQEGAVSWVVKDPSTQKYFRFGQLEVWLMQRMDGQRSLQQICDELREEIGMNASPQALDVLVRRLREMGLVERSLEERSALMLERVRQQRRNRAKAETSLMRMRFSAGDPDPVLTTMVERMPFFWTRGFVAVSAIAILVYGSIVITNWNNFVASSAALYSPAQMTLGVFLICYGSFAITAIIHEFGHGLTCKRHGGEVHEMGAMLLYFMPAFYCNVSDAWTFERRSARLWVTVAGGWIQLWVAALAAILWMVTEPGTLLNSIGLYTAVLSGGFSLLLNYNPLIPLDGYYALVDMLNMSNLRARSFEYVGAVVKRHVLRLNTALPAVTDRERRIFLIYGLLSAAYTTAILTFVAVLVGRFLGTHLGGWGWVLFAFLLFKVTASMRSNAARMARLVITEKFPAGRRARVLSGGGLALLLLAVVALVTPWTVQAPGSAVIEPEGRHWARPLHHGRFIDRVAQEGEHVRAGAVLAVLRDPGLEVERAQLHAHLHQIAALSGAARAGRDAAGGRIADLDAETVTARLTLLEQQRAALVLRAPVDAVVVTPWLEERIGESIAAGDSLIELWSGALYAHIQVPQSDAGEIAEGASIRIRFPAVPSRTWRAQVDRIEPAATDHGVIIFAALPADAATVLRPGMRGRARVAVARTTIAGAIGRAVRRTVRGDLFL